MANNVKKTFNPVANPVRADKTRSAKSGVQTKNYSGRNDGQLTGDGSSQQAFGKPLNSHGISAAIGGLSGLHNDIGELSGFAVDGYLDKQETPFGEAAKFNFLPPGMDISNQENVEIHEMPLRILVAESYPEDGWTPAPRDIEE